MKTRYLSRFLSSVLVAGSLLLSNSSKASDKVDKELEAIILEMSELALRCGKVIEHEDGIKSYLLVLRNGSGHEGLRKN